MKKIIIVICFAILLSQQVCHASNNISNSNFIEEDISHEEYLRIRAEDEGISIQEADKLDKLENEAFMKAYARKNPIKHFLSSIGLSSQGTVNEIRLTELFTYPGNSNFKAQQSIVIKVYGNGSYKQINGVWGHRSRRVAGLYQSNWIESSKNVLPLTIDNNEISFPCYKIKFRTIGYFETKVDTSVSGSVDVIPGFLSVGAQVGSTLTFLSQDMYMESEYSLD